MLDAVRYQYYRSSDGFVLFMASERKFWRNFCEGVGRLDLFDANPGAEFGDHARGNLPLRRELREIFATRTTAEWIDFGREVNTPIAPVNSPKTIADDPQFRDRFPWLPATEHGSDLMPTPIKPPGGELPPPAMAPTAGEHTDAILAEVCGYDSARIAHLRDEGVVA